MTTLIESDFPKDPNISKTAYTAALRAKVLDCLRGLLPASTLTNMGLYGNGQFFEQLIHKLHSQNMTELQEIGKHAYDELFKVMPSFIRRAGLSHHTHQSYTQYYEALQSELNLITQQHEHNLSQSLESGIRLVASDPNAVIKVVGITLFKKQ